MERQYSNAINKGMLETWIYVLRGEKRKRKRKTRKKFIGGGMRSGLCNRLGGILSRAPMLTRGIGSNEEYYDFI